MTKYDYNMLKIRELNLSSAYFDKILSHIDKYISNLRFSFASSKARDLWSKFEMYSYKQKQG
jgi:hypothetical protein